MGYRLRVRVSRSAALARMRAWVSIARLFPLAGRGVVACCVLLNLAIGLLPIGFIVGTSVMLERVPALADADHGGSAWRAVLSAFAVAVGALAAQNTLTPLQTALGELVTRRIDGHCARRLMTACVADAPMQALESREFADRVGDARAHLLDFSATPGAAAAGLLALIARYAQLFGALALIGYVLGPAAGCISTVLALLARFGNRGSLGRWTAVFARMRTVRRQMAYVLDTGSSVALAKEMRVLGILRWFTERAQAESDAYLRPLWRERRRIYFAPFLGITALVLVGAVAVLLILEREAAGGGLSVLRLSLAVQAVYVPMRFGVFFPEADVQTQYGMQAYETITDLEREFAEAGPVPIAGTSQSPPPTSAVGIRFDRVSFAYRGSDRLVLDELDLELEAGRSTAVVGLNGAGKTTLVKLLTRLYQPTGGAIRANGVDIADLDLNAWQRRIAVIFQDFIRYELDARANITLGAAHRLGDDAALRRAAERAGADDVLSALQYGAATTLSSRYRGGVDLSGGQWQRVALARALFAVEAGAGVLVLDEPTAQLDVRAEVAFFDRFLEITEGLTTVVISHRFSTVRRAHRIVLLGEGRVLERGTHDELLSLGGRYAKLFELQARRFDDRGDESESGLDDVGTNNA